MKHLAGFQEGGGDLVAAADLGLAAADAFDGDGVQWAEGRPESAANCLARLGAVRSVFGQGGEEFEKLHDSDLVVLIRDVTKG